MHQQVQCLHNQGHQKWNEQRGLRPHNRQFDMHTVVVCRQHLKCYPWDCLRDDPFCNISGKPQDIYQASSDLCQALHSRLGYSQNTISSMHMHPALRGQLNQKFAKLLLKLPSMSSKILGWDGRSTALSIMDLGSTGSPSGCFPIKASQTHSHLMMMAIRH